MFLSRPLDRGVWTLECGGLAPPLHTLQYNLPKLMTVRYRLAYDVLTYG
jgi:hypothetical protein